MWESWTKDTKQDDKHNISLTFILLDIETTSALLRSSCCSAVTSVQRIVLFEILCVISLWPLIQVLLRSSDRSACGPAPRHLIQSEWQDRAFGQKWQPVREVVHQQAHAAQPYRCLRHNWVPGRRTLQQSHGDSWNKFTLLSKLGWLRMTSPLDDIVLTPQEKWLRIPLAKIIFCKWT